MTDPPQPFFPLSAEEGAELGVDGFWLEESWEGVSELLASVAVFGAASKATGQ